MKIKEEKNPLNVRGGKIFFLVFPRTMEKENFGGWGKVDTFLLIIYVKRFNELFWGCVENLDENSNLECDLFCVQSSKKKGRSHCIIKKRKEEMKKENSNISCLLFMILCL